MDIDATTDSPTLEERRKRIFERLNARHLKTTASQSQTIFGLQELEHLLAEAKDLLSNENSVIKIEFMEKLESALSLLPSGFESRRLRDLHGKLRARLQQKKVDLSMFSFKSKEQPMEPVNVSTPALEKLPSTTAPVVISRSKDSRMVSNLYNQTYEVQGTTGDDVAIMNISNCNIAVQFEASTVHLKEVTNSVIVLAPVQSSIMMRDCSNLTLVAAAQQLRIHESNRLRLHVAVRSAVIIEDCDDVRVAPYRVKNISLDWENSNWKNVKDFNWLAVDKQSPHWSIMEEDSWKTFDFSFFLKETS